MSKNLDISKNFNLPLFQYLAMYFFGINKWVYFVKILVQKQEKT